jgi:hypothetical protein
MVPGTMMFPKQTPASRITCNLLREDFSDMIERNIRCQIKIKWMNVDGIIQNTDSIYVLKCWLTVSVLQTSSEFFGFEYQRPDHSMHTHRTTMHDLQMGLILISESEWPSFLYPQGTEWDLDDDKTELFRGYLLPARECHGFLNPRGLRVRFTRVRVRVGEKNPGKTRTLGKGLTGFEGYDPS